MLIWCTRLVLVLAATLIDWVRFFRLRDFSERLRGGEGRCGKWVFCVVGKGACGEHSKMQKQSCGGGFTIQFYVEAGSCWMGYSGSDKRLHGFFRISLQGQLDELVELRRCYSCTVFVSRAMKDFIVFSLLCLIRVVEGGRSFCSG